MWCKSFIAKFPLPQALALSTVAAFSSALYGIDINVDKVPVSMVVEHLRTRECADVSFIDSGQRIVVSLNLRDATVGEVLSKIAAQSSAYRSEKIAGRDILYPTAPEFQVIVDNVDIQRKPRQQATELYVDLLRRAVPAFARLVPPVLFGDDRLPIYSDKVTLRPKGRVIEHFVDLLGENRGLFFKFIQAKSGLPSLDFESLSCGAARSQESLGTPKGSTNCRLSIAQPQACAQSSLFVTLRCRSETQKPLEWLEPNDSRVEWELKRPDGQVERTNVSRYSTSPELVGVAFGNDLNLTLPVTRWFSIKIPGAYRLRFQLKDMADSVQIETNATEFNVVSCSDDALIKACRSVLQSTYKNRLEAIAGFDSASVVPCMEEALQEQSEFSVSIIDGLARMQTASAIEALLRRFKIGNAFERLEVWKALHGIDRSKLGTDLLRRIDTVLKETPITMKD